MSPKHMKGSELGHDTYSHGTNCTCPKCNTVYEQRKQLLDAIERIKEASPRMTDAERVEAARQIRKLEHRYEYISPPRTHSEMRPYRNEYKCPHGNKTCGENAIYCEPCNRRYEEFLWLLNDDR